MRGKIELVEPFAIALSLVGVVSGLVAGIGLGADRGTWPISLPLAAAVALASTVVKWPELPRPVSEPSAAANEPGWSGGQENQGDPRVASDITPEPTHERRLDPPPPVVERFDWEAMVNIEPWTGDQCSLCTSHDWKADYCRCGEVSKCASEARQIETGFAFLQETRKMARDV